MDKNKKLLEQFAGKKNPMLKHVGSFARIRSFGDKNSAMTHDNIRVERREFIPIEGYGLVKCLPTTMHFVYEDTSRKIGRWTYMCTCGGIAGIISYKELNGLVTPETGEYVLACIAGVSSKQNVGTFIHADGSTE